MKVLFVMPYNCDLIHAVSIPTGILSIATYVKAAGFDAEICDLSVTHCNIEKVFRESKADIVGISMGSVKHLDGAVYVSKKLKKFNVPIVWGGPFCDVCDPAVLLGSGYPDYLSLSEGEGTWLEILQCLSQNRSIKDCAGLAFMENDKCVCTPDREFLDLAAMPALDFSLIDVRAYGQYLYGCKNLVYVYLSKGCPAKCTFCTNQLSHRCQYRRRSLDTFMSELKVLANEYGVDGIYFSDELCFYNKAQLYEVCDALDKSCLELTWGFQTRIGVLGEEEFIRAHKSGCRWVDFGIESGNKEQLRLMKKAIPYDKIEPTFRWCESAGIISLANFIIGLPGETENQLKDTVRLASEIHATQCSFFKYCISPLTEMGKYALMITGKNNPIKSIKDYKRVDFFNSRTSNYSYVPVKDLDVIQSFYLWNAIFRKDYGEKTRAYDLLFKHMLTLLKRLSFLNFKCAVSCFFELVFLFLRFFKDTYFHPSIIKKYNLKKS